MPKHIPEGLPNMTFKPSTHQRKIFDFVTDGAGSAIVKAVAGSGKSTTIKQALLRIPESASVQVFAFNSHIAKEMRDGVQQLGLDEGRSFARVRVSTFHSVGFSAVCRKLSLKPTQVSTDGKKVREVLKELFRAELRKHVHPSDLEEAVYERYELYGDFCFKLVGFAKGEGFGALVPADEKDWLRLIQHHDLNLDSELATEEQAVAYARSALRLSNEMAKKGTIDFDDQLYLPLLWKLRLWENDWVFIDEAQDTNPVRRAIAKLALRPGGRLVAVGDPKQAIYGFTGASHDALDLIQKEFNCVELPLTISYRCAPEIVKFAKRLVPYLEANPKATDAGDVKFVPDLKEALKLLQSTDAIMCRNTAPLIELAFALVGQGVGCKVLGREIGSSLVTLVRNQKAKGIENLMAKLERYREREVAKHTAAGNEGKAEAVNDRVACVRTIVENLPESERTIPKLVTKIEALFSDNDTRKVLTLSTLHKLKGAEFERVYLYQPELCPSKWARQEWQMQQENNLLYVGYTRAKKMLIIGGPNVYGFNYRKEAA